MASIFATVLRRNRVTHLAATNKEMADVLKGIRVRRVLSTVLLSILIAGSYVAVYHLTRTDAAPSATPSPSMISRSPRQAATGDYPAMTSLMLLKDGGYRHECGAALVSRRYAVTAAHCVNEEATGTTWHPMRMRMRVGSADAYSGGQVVIVTAVHVYPDWRWELKPPRRHADLAVLQLAHDVSLEPLAVATQVAPAAPVRLIGWGREPVDVSSPPPPDFEAHPLRELDGVVVGPSRCADQPITDAEVCLEPSNSSAPCRGDSGSPALQRTAGRWQLVGVLSRGTAAGTWCEQISPGLVVTDLTNPDYRSWIERITCTPPCPLGPGAPGRVGG